MLKFATIGLVWAMIIGSTGCTVLEVIDDHMDCTYVNGQLDCTVDKDV